MQYSTGSALDQRLHSPASKNIRTKSLTPSAHMNTRDLHWWARLFAAEAGAARAALEDFGFERDLPRQPRAAAAFLAWRLWRSLGVPVSRTSPILTPADPSDLTQLDSFLWQACLDPGLAIDLALDACRDRGRSRMDAGSLIPQGLHLAIEAWTEAEFSALHALSRLAVLRQRPDLEAMCFRVAEWHLENTQPDNATNRPWSAHVFAQLASDGNAEAGLFAQTFMHNARAGASTLDLLSMQICADGAECLDAGGGPLTGAER